MCAEYIVSNGNYNVMLCERGIRTFETATRNTFDLNAVPLVKQTSHLPVVADPSHGTGLRELVPAMAKASVAAGADALILEVHPDPDNAISDGRQSLTLEAFAELMKDLRRVAVAVDRYIAKRRPSKRKNWPNWPPSHRRTKAKVERTKTQALAADTAA